MFASELAGIKPQESEDYKKAAGIRQLQDENELQAGKYFLPIGER